MVDATPRSVRNARLVELTAVKGIKEREEMSARIRENNLGR
jgi:hypothetical protein